MKVRLFLLGLLFATQSFAQQVVVRITADNFYGVYTGTVNAAATLHGTGNWPQAQTLGPFTPAGDYLYVTASDDGSTYQGLLATVQAGTGFVTTGSPLWEVCATSRGATPSQPTPGNLTPAILACNRSNGWHATSNGVNNGNSPLVPMWPRVALIDDAASWIWDTNGSVPCAGNNGFLRGSCNPGEYLIFRLPLKRAQECTPPVPDFTINWTAGYGTFVADGTNSQAEQNHFWSIQESDQWWNTIGPEINQWFPNQAGAFDLKAFFEGKGQRLKCDTYYRVKLAVGNQCVGWRDTIRLVRLKCCPGEVTRPRGGHGEPISPSMKENFSPISPSGKENSE